MQNESMNTTDFQNSQKQPAKLRSKIVFLCGLYFLLLIFGALVVYFLERAQDWSLVDSFYFMTITLLTIGYGDLAPKSEMGRLFIAVYSLVGVTFSAYIFFAVGRYFIQSKMGSLWLTHKK